jgi:hypothetical protein
MIASGRRDSIANNRSSNLVDFGMLGCLPISVQRTFQSR